MAAGSTSVSKTLVWILMALLILGLAGFGATNLSGTIRSIGAVGDKDIPVTLYARTLRSEIDAISAQTQQPLPFATAQQFGIDQQALSRVITARALDHETAQLGLSVSDAELKKQILEIPAFQGIDGSFDRNAYRFALENAGLSESEFEESIREETARTLVQGAILSGNSLPDSFAETIASFAAQERAVTLARLTVSDLDNDIAAPTEAELSAFYADNQSDYMLPETRKLTYAWLSPDMILETVEVDEEALRKSYEDRSAEFNTPERRLVERLVFATTEEASAAKARIDSTESSFEQEVTARGLTMDDVDLGDLTQEALGNAGAAVFAAQTGDVTGPVDTDLGPALIRINGILAAQNTSYDDAKAQLRDALASDRARRVIEAQVNDIDDLLAAGATLEDLAKETEMQLGQIDWSADSEDGIAAYDAFRKAANSVTAEDFPEIITLEDGGIFALRLNDILPERPQPLDEIKERVTAGFTAAKTLEALRSKASALVPQIAADTDFSALGLTAERVEHLTRTGFTDALPRSALTDVFKLAAGETLMFDDASSVVIARLDEITEADLKSQDLQDMIARINDQAAGSISQDLFQAFATDIQNRAGIQLDQTAINAVHANFQ